MRLSLADKSEKFSDGQSQSFGHYFKCIERGGILATFYQAKEVYRNIQRLGKALLRHSALKANLFQPLSELSA